MVELTEDEKRKFRLATRCHVCGKSFQPEDKRVRDHCHLTGRYRSPAHSRCNLNYRNVYVIPVFFHNLSGYDAHFVVEKIANEFEGKVDLLPLTKESYISFSKTVKKTQTDGEWDRYVKLRFVDSYKFLAASIETLASYLNKDKLRITRSEYADLSAEDLDLLTRKGVFPYEYVDSVDKLRETELPPREAFYSSLTDETASESDYEHATRVWRRFRVRDLGEYSDLYLKTDLDDPENFDATTVPADSDVGYILEVDLEYPRDLHDAHADLPLCPTRDKPPGKRQEKLLATLYDKSRYVTHYRNLQQCLRLGMRLTRVRRVLQFAQSPWLCVYIKLNTALRMRASNKFERNLYKLMNNAVFGKTMENLRDHADVRLVTRWDGRYGAEALIAKPNFHSRSVFSENLVAIELRRLEVKFNKPIYVGMSTLEISKTRLYEYYYDYMLPLYCDRCRIAYTDTDSLIYSLECEDAYERMKRDVHRFDTSDYAENNAQGMPRVNKKVPGLMKDENNGAIMTEFVGLRAKMYTYRVLGRDDTKKIKGVKRNVVAKRITFEDYVACLRNARELKTR
ncbi:uncharacterized protein LOC143897994 [Temnothorax americanus]|uniref:uncharacterized protein LOC143897994 n=1 Tax=Temnothorax americanus TaxID=1964332 RepID=UPI0040688F96